MSDAELGPNQAPELDFIIMNLADIKDFNLKKQQINRHLLDGWYIVDSYIIGDSAFLMIMEHIINK